MKATLMLLGACALAPFAGAFAGASINTTPLEAAGDPLATVPQHESDFGGDIAYGGLDAPDHYPLVTRHGTIPVEELMLHGALGRRYYPYLSAPSAAPAPSFAGDSPAPAPAADDGEARRAADIARLTPLDEPAAPSLSPALAPADPQLPPGARGMLTAVTPPALPGGGAT